VLQAKQAFIREWMAEGVIDRRALPVVSTIDLILKQHRLVKKRQRARRLREVHPFL
jgi:hypothetical protein